MKKFIVVIFCLISVCAFAQKRSRTVFTLADGKLELFDSSTGKWVSKARGSSLNGSDWVRARGTFSLRDKKGFSKSYSQCDCTLVSSLNPMTTMGAVVLSNDVITREVAEYASREAFVVVTDVIPDAMLDIRYYGTYNFIGNRIPGYDHPVAMLTRRAADSLKVVSDELLAKGYRIKIYDCYRPQKAVDFFLKWALDTLDVRMKPYFYPELDKCLLVPEKYVAEKSSHTRGSTVDLTLFDMSEGKDVDMGCTFDYFGIASHPDVLPGQEIGGVAPITEEQYRNRMILREAMTAHGFKPYSCEWWHFTLEDEPFPDTYFDFDL